jgi:putative phosphoesterase
MRIVLFSDVHANLPALQACLQHIDQEDPDVIYCLGDLVGYNVWPNEVVEEIRKRKIPTIAGNYDEGIGLNSDECGCAYKTDEEKAMGKISISYTNSIVTDTSRAYLRDLPAHIRIEYKNNDEHINLLLVHGSPRKINEYLFEDREEKSFLRIMTQAGADIMCFGHTHKPFHRIFETEQEGKQRFYHAVNLGSVGKPKDGDPRGCYVIIELNEGTRMHDSNSVKVEFKRFDYDVKKAAVAVEGSPLPNEYAEMLRKGG